MDVNNEEAARIFVNAIRRFAENPGGLDNLESYLSETGGAFMECFAAIEHNFAKINRANQRKQNIMHKGEDHVRNMNFHRMRDAYKRTMRRKGAGQHGKVKGETMNTGVFCSNTKCAKGWERHFLGDSRYGEGINAFFIWDRT